jgi:hypothetical protein
MRGGLTHSGVWGGVLPETRGGQARRTVRWESEKMWLVGEVGGGGVASVVWGGA